MESEKQEINESQIKHTLLSKQYDNTDVIIISDDEEEEEEATLEPKKKMQKFGFAKYNVDPFDELGKVLKGYLPETKEENVVYASTNLNEKKNVVESSTSNKAYGHVSLDDLGVSVEDLKSIPWEAFEYPKRSWANDPWLGGHIEDMSSPHNNSDN